MIHLLVCEHILAGLDVQAWLITNQDTKGFGGIFGDVVGLNLVASFVTSFRVADHLDEVIQIAESQKVGLQFFGVLLSLVEKVAGTTQNHFTAMLDVANNGVLDVEQARPAVVDRQHVGRERRLQRGVLVKVVENDLRAGITLEIDNHAGVFVRLISDGANLRKNLGIRQFRDALNEFGAVHDVGDFSDDDLLTPFRIFFDGSTASHFDAASSGRGVVIDAAVSENSTASGEVWALDVFEQLFNRDLWVVDRGTGAVDHFAEVVWRNISRHAHCNTSAAVDEQIRERSRENDWLLAGLIVVGNEVDRGLLHIRHDDVTEVGEAGLSVSHRSRRVAFDRTKVTLTVDEYITHGPGLSHVDQRWINRGFPVRVVVTGGVTADFGALSVVLTGGEAKVIHREQNASL